MSRVRPNQRRVKTIGERFPKAPRRLFCGQAFIKLPCEMCKELIWSFVDNDRCVCDWHLPDSITELYNSQHPAHPIRNEQADF